jgi:hypothetical protein
MYPHASCRECASIERSQALKAFNFTVAFSSPVMASLATFTTFWALGNDLQASAVFSVLGLLHILRMRWATNVALREPLLRVTACAARACTALHLRAARVV